MQFYTDPSRESEKWSLPDAEVFPVDLNDVFDDCHSNQLSDLLMENGLQEEPDIENRVHRDLAKDMVGWYWWPCFPGCLPDSDPIGPFETEAEAIADAQEDS